MNLTKWAETAVSPFRYIPGGKESISSLYNKGLEMLIGGNRRFFVITSSIFVGIFLLSRCNISDKSTSDGQVQYSAFAGSTACATCHKDISRDHLKTGHFLSTAAASRSVINGNFEKGKNEYHFSDFSSVAMEEKGNNLFQVEYVMGSEKRSGKMDIVVGSGRKGQSYLSWKNNSLVQLPVTYFTPESTWSSSPGFHPRKIAFNRVVTSRCLECHSTFFKKISPVGKHPEEFDRQEIIYGIDCEKCHGPAKEHVNFHTENPGQSQAKYIVNPANMSRQQKLDLCALCHSGRLAQSKPAFSFQPGDELSDYFSIQSAAPEPGNIDVHGNQFGLLSMSKCFTATDMTCGSCHNVHDNEKNRLEVFSQRCLNCHTGEQHNQCKLTKSIGDVIRKNCIDCHMPLQLSQSIAVYLEGGTVPTPAKLRTHYIKIYNEESEKILKILKMNSDKGNMEKN